MKVICDRVTEVSTTREKDDTVVTKSQERMNTEMCWRFLISAVQ